MTNTLPPSANMQIVLPVVLGELGPLWASELNTALGTTVDAHDHTSGKGVKVPIAGLNVNADLPFTGFGPTVQQYSRFASRALPSSGTLPYSVFVGTDGNLYFQNTNGVGGGTGANVKITNGDSVTGVAGATAGFGGAYNNTTNADAFYNATTTPVYAFFSTPTPIFSLAPAYSSNSIASIARVYAAGFDAIGAQTSTNAFTAVTASDANHDAAGFRLSATAGTIGYGMTVKVSSTGTQGTGFDLTGLTAAPLGTAGNAGIGVNIAVPLAVFHGQFNSTVGNAIQLVSRLQNIYTGAASTGFGTGSYFYGSGTASAAAVFYGRIAFSLTGNNNNAGVVITDGLNGALATNPVLTSNGAGAYGLGVAVIAATTAGIYAGVTFKPFIDATYDLGSSALRWVNGYFSAMLQTPQVTGTTTLGLTATAGALVLSSSTQILAAQQLLPNAANTYTLGAAGGNYWLAVGTAKVDWRNTGGGVGAIQSSKYDGIVHHAVSVSSGGAKVYEYTVNNSATIGHPGTGQYTVTLSSAAPATQCLFFAQFAEASSGAGNVSVGVAQISTTLFNITVSDSGSLVDKRWNFMILSTGF